MAQRAARAKELMLEKEVIRLTELVRVQQKTIDRLRYDNLVLIGASAWNTIDVQPRPRDGAEAFLGESYHLVSPATPDPRPRRRETLATPPAAESGLTAAGTPLDAPLLSRLCDVALPQTASGQEPTKVEPAAAKRKGDDGGGAGQRVASKKPRVGSSPVAAEASYRLFPLL